MQSSSIRQRRRRRVLLTAASARGNAGHSTLLPLAMQTTDERTGRWWTAEKVLVSVVSRVAACVVFSPEVVAQAHRQHTLLQPESGKISSHDAPRAAASSHAARRKSPEQGALELGAPGVAVAEESVTGRRPTERHFPGHFP